MTPRQKMIDALLCRPVSGHVPTFELVFFLTMEKFGRVHPSQRHYGQWDQMSEAERNLHRLDVADLYIQTARAYHHSAIFINPPPVDRPEEVMRQCELIRERSGEEHLTMIHGDATFSIPDGAHMTEFAYRMADDPEGLKRQAAKQVDDALRVAERYARHGMLDAMALCSDYCFNTNPFMSPAQFSEFVTPYLDRLIRGYRDMGFYVIKHTDGNIMPILDQLIQCRPHALHSIDPQAGVSLAEVKRRVTGEQICLCGNVHCGLLETGTDEEVAADVRRSLAEGMEGWGYIFCTSNCVYTGMPLARYELMMDIYEKEGVYPALPKA